MYMSAVVHPGFFWGGGGGGWNLVESILPSAWESSAVPLAAAQAQTMIHPPPSTPMHNRWPGVVFTKCDALCSPSSPMLILACNQCSKTIGCQDWFPKCTRLLEIVLMPTSHAEICGEDTVEAIFVQVSLNSWTVYHNSRVCQIFFFLFCSQISVPTSCFSSDAMSTFAVHVPLTFLFFIIWWMMEMATWKHLTNLPPVLCNCLQEPLDVDVVETRWVVLGYL